AARDRRGARRRPCALEGTSSTATSSRRTSWTVLVPPFVLLMRSRPCVRGSSRSRSARAEARQVGGQLGEGRERLVRVHLRGSREEGPLGPHARRGGGRGPARA